MPRSSVLLTPRAVDAQAVAEAAGAVCAQLDAPELTLQPVDDGAALQVLAGAELLLTVTRPRVLPRLDESARLRPGADTAGVRVPTFWTDAYTPWTASGAIGVAILTEIARALGGVVDHDRSPKPTTAADG